MTAAEEFEFSLARPADEPEIRRLVGGTPMPGAVTIRFEREPDYFLGCPLMRDPCDVLIARHLPDGALAGLICRSERWAFVNGRETRIGAIGQIRIDERYRGHWILQRGWRELGLLGSRDLTYVGVIARDNPRARGTLVGRRPPGALAATRLAGMTTFALVLSRFQPSAIKGCAIERASQETIAEIVAFLRVWGARRQFFPAYRIEDFAGGTATRGLELEDLSVARRGGSIVGVMGMWDQSTYKQDVVHAYGSKLRRLRPVYDLGARAIGARPLPAPGEPIRSAFAAFVCVADDDPDVFRSLLRATCERARAGGFAFVTIGLTDDDPLLPAARRWPHITYRSDLYVLSWSRHDPAAELDGRVPHVEIATL
jgi:hypothetical protein